MTPVVIPLEAQDRDGLGDRQFGDRIECGLTLRRSEKFFEEATAIGYLSPPERLAVVLGITQRPEMQVIDSRGGKVIGQFPLGKPWLARQRSKTHVDEHLDALVLQLMNELVNGASFVTD
jgi:hypothetical protein